MFTALSISFAFNTFLRRHLRFSIAVVLLAACQKNVASYNEPAGTLTPAAVTETARSAYDFVNSIGVNVHLNYFDTIYGNFPLVRRELTSIGIRHVRDGVHLQNADYNDTLYGRWVQLGKIGVRFDAVLDPRSNLGPVTPALLDRVNRLAGQTIESFEGPNELDISNLPDWPSIDRNYQTTLFDSTRSMASGGSIKVIGPSMASASNGAQVGALSDQIDFGNLHPYPAAQMPSVVFPKETNLAKAISGDKELVFTESGYHNALRDHSDQPAVSETAAAKYIPRLFLEDFARGIVRTYLYEFFDESLDPELNHFQMHWGLIRADGSEKPAFAAMTNLIGELEDDEEPAQLQQLTWTLSTTNTSVHHLLLEQSTGELDLVLWQEVASYNPSRQTDVANVPVTADLTLRQRAHAIALYEPVKQAQALHTYTDVASVPLEISDHPLVVKIVLK
jgi:hypothetical protein